MWSGSLGKVWRQREEGAERDSSTCLRTETDLPTPEADNAHGDKVQDPLHAVTTTNVCHDLTAQIHTWTTAGATQVYYGLWAIMMRQSKFSLGKKKFS